MIKIIKTSLAVGALTLALTGCFEVHVDGKHHWATEPFRLLPENKTSGNITITFPEATHQNGIEAVFSHGVIHALDDGTFSYLSKSGEDVTIDFEVAHLFGVNSGTLVIRNMTSDPLYGEQWHLHNAGQSAFSGHQSSMDAYIAWAKVFFALDDADIANDPERFTFDPSLRVAWEDLSVTGAHARGYTGKGVVVAVTDTGLEMRHEDLAENIRYEGSANFEDPGSNDPTNNTDARGDHGTSVAGLIGAVGGNGLGGRGVAPEVTLLGQNFLKKQTDESMAFIQGITGPADVDVINKSWGFTLFLQSDGIFHDGGLDSYLDAYPALNLREGLGAMVIKAAGNSFDASDLSDPFFGYGLALCENNGANLFGLTCDNAAINAGNNHPWQMVVGGVNADGTHTSYSTAGSALWVSAPAGEFGFREPAMVTTDQSSCDVGYSGSATETFYFENYGGYPYADIYPFNGVNTPLNNTMNPHCNYVQTFNGTSSAAPNASGVVALMLDANPHLDWRDIKHILASTSDQVDRRDPAIKLPVGDSEYTAHDGWVANAAGYTYNNLYGFGRINAEKAVKVAADYRLSLAPFSQSHWVSAIPELAVPDNTATGATHTLTINDTGVVEVVKIKVSLSNSGMKTLIVDNDTGSVLSSTVGSDTAIELTSPSGTKSIMMTARTGVFASYDWGIGLPEEKRMYQDMMLLSNAFYGEPAAGNWTIRVVDTNGKNIQSGHPAFVFENNTADSVLDSWGIALFGQHFEQLLLGDR
ncbi:S8 family serine peptidase [Candidatus Sororendozoicomonas aggregata]|uniref:S8 family serine peptidase n=1 Tax=Candidatus Sororendozoicomonas aggregata TaxID=3073239 RepID=UPI002ED3C574